METHNKNVEEYAQKKGSLNQPKIAKVCYHTLTLAIVAERSFLCFGFHWNATSCRGAFKSVIKQIPNFKGDETARKDAKKRYPRQENDGLEKKWTMSSVAEKGHYLCLYCDKETPYDKSDRGGPKSLAVQNIPASQACRDLLLYRYKHRTKTVCPSCAPLIKGFLESVDKTDTASKEDILSEVQALASRYDGTGAVDAQGRHHSGVWQRQTCQLIFDLDRTSKDLATKVKPLLNDQDIADGIRDAFSQASFSAKPAMQSDNATEVETEQDLFQDASRSKQAHQTTLDELGWIVTARIDDSESAPPSEGKDWKTFFVSAPNIGHFKSLFCLYFLEKYAVSDLTRLSCLSSVGGDCSRIDCRGPEACLGV